MCFALSPAAVIQPLQKQAPLDFTRNPRFVLPPRKAAEQAAPEPPAAPPDADMMRNWSGTDVMRSTQNQNWMYRSAVAWIQNIQYGMVWSDYIYK